MGLPNIIINFKSTGTTAIKRGERGIVAIVLKDSSNEGFKELENIKEIPEGLSEANKKYIERAFIGGINPPRKVVIYVLSEEAEDYSAAYSYLETVKFDYIVGAPDMSSELATAMATWVKSQRDEFDKKIKAVLPSTASDHEGIINFDTNSIKIKDETLTTAQFCSRIAGLIAGTPLDVSCTFTILPEVIDIPRKTITQVSSDIDSGKFVLYHDGEKVRVARGVNSLTTVNADKGKELKKIKVVDIIDLIHYDIRKTTHDDFIGKFPNSYDNKCLLVTAIKDYFTQLENENILEKDSSIIEIDLAAQEEYLKKNGVDTSSMSEQEIKSANTGDKIFLKSSIKPLDAIEEVTINVSI